MKTDHLLKVDRAEIRYGKRIAVQDVSFAVRPGEILGIVGESGSGKSTLLKAAMGLLGTEGAVTAGDILYEGNSILTARPEELRQIRGTKMGMIFQDTQSSLCPVRKIESQLYESVRQHEKISRKEIRKKALELFEQMRLPDGEKILKSYPFELSGGMNQRVGIVMAMIQNPRLLLADEPTSALDVTVQAQVVKELLDLQRKRGTAIVLVTHNMSLVEHMADTVAVMYQGHLIEYGKKEEIIGHPQEAYTRKLLDAVLKIQ